MMFDYRESATPFTQLPNGTEIATAYDCGEMYGGWDLLWGFRVVRVFAFLGLSVTAPHPNN